MSSHQRLTVTQVDRQTSERELCRDDVATIRTVGVMTKHSAIDFRDASSEDLANFAKGLESVDNIVGECMKNVPGWSDFDPSSITIKQLCEGLSNQAYAVSVSDAISPKTGQRVAQRVLFRVYGKQVSKLYDPKAELHIFDTLSKYRIAPELIGTGDGWRIEEWHYAVAVPCALMNNSSIPVSYTHLTLPTKRIV
eukprot:TRINITY_DN1253_c0_g1_i19.p1 TRINITY_DN1253_c0_g1~~TRINITY_DN1253_c0_g1_i19.p1  ORF type:complete len:195 (-),score=58.53 TRINITY_DN1253_c0_g1_i19:160-744(-)